MKCMRGEGMGMQEANMEGRQTVLVYLELRCFYDFHHLIRGVVHFVFVPSLLLSILSIPTDQSTFTMSFLARASRLAARMTVRPSLSTRPLRTMTTASVPLMQEIKVETNGMFVCHFISLSLFMLHP